MLLGAIGDNLYNTMLIVHLLAVVVAFGTLFALPALRRSDAASASRLYLRFALPALVVVWVAGMGLVGMSDDAFELTDTWIVLSLGIWLVLVALGAFVLRPALSGGEAAAKRASMATGVSHLLLVVGLYLMVFQPAF